MLNGSNKGVPAVLQWIDRDYIMHDDKTYLKEYYKEQARELEDSWDTSGGYGSWLQRRKNRKQSMKDLKDAKKDLQEDVRKEYAREIKDLERIIVGPDEYAVVIRDGKITDTYTQKQVSEMPGFWARLGEKLFSGKEDIQIILADTRKHNMQVRFEAYTKDRVRVRGFVDLFASINIDDIGLALRLMNEAQGISVKPGFREVTVEDISRVIGSNLNYVIDTEAISNYTSRELEENRRGICLDMISALNSKTPYWANYGLKVNYSTITFSDNKFEELERMEVQNRLRMKEMDIEAALSEAESGDRIRAEDLRTREAALLGISAEIAEYTADIALNSKKKEAILSEEDDQSEISMRARENQNRYEMMVAYHLKELRRVQDYDIDDKEKELRVAEIESRIHELQMQNKESEYRLESQKQRDSFNQEQVAKDNDIQREIDLINAKAASVRAMAAGDEEIRKMEISQGIDKQRQQAEIERVRAEAMLAGYKEADATKHRQHMDELNVTKDMLGAANKGIDYHEIRCPNCGKINKSMDTFCGSCGSKLSGGDQ